MIENKTFGILIFTKKIKENDLFVKVLLNNDQFINGIIYGGNTSKKRNIYQIGYYLDLNIQRKNINSPYSINAEIKHPLIGSIINDKYKLNCLLSIVSIINLSIIQDQKIIGIYKILDNFINKLISNNKWIIFYSKWLFDLLKVIGYEIDYKSNAEKNYFDLELLEFTSNNSNNTIFFPHDYLNHNQKVKYKYLLSIFEIFEYIFKKNHLLNYDYKLPENYINFKKLILTYLKNRNE